MKRIDFRKVDYRHYILTAITLGFLALSVFVFPTGINRIIEGGRDLGLSLAYYFMEIIEVEHNIQPTVNSLPAVYSKPFLEIAENFEQFKADWAVYWQRWATKENFSAYMEYLGDLIYKLSKVLLIVMPFFLLLYIGIRAYFNTENNDYDKDSKPLRAWKRFTKAVYVPVRDWLISFFAFIRENGIYKTLWAWIWAYNFNVIAIALEFFAFYFYFIMSFDFAGIYTQVYKLLIDLSPAIVFIPTWVWVIVGVIVFDKIRKKIGYNVLNHHEMKNRGFINDRPIVYMVCGTMGKKKTTAITDMALSQEVMFRDEALERMYKNDLKFPNFPWINLENELKKKMRSHTVYNLATTRSFIDKKQARWKRRACRENIFGYDYERYGLYYDDKLKSVYVWEVIRTYAQLYFIYVIQSSLIISNYSVRTDNFFMDRGNFPLWDTEFFPKHRKDIANSRYAHILDFDMLRLGKKLLEGNKYSNVFEFGVILVTEIGKERGNTIELAEKKKKDETANQKNDLFNSWLKMVRHSATVDNFPFVRVIADEQRPESWGADARDLCEIVHIEDSGTAKLAMPFFTLAEILYDWIFSKFCNLYYEYRHIRADNTLLMHFLKSFTAGVEHYYTGIYNRFGYSKLRGPLESGTQDGNAKTYAYYLAFGKIYNGRFFTACHMDFFDRKALFSKYGIDDLPEYQTDKAKWQELTAQNSYFVGDLVDGMNKIIAENSK